jgi:hypothetical protein
MVQEAIVQQVRVEWRGAFVEVEINREGMSVIHVAKRRRGSVVSKAGIAWSVTSLFR